MTGLATTLKHENPVVNEQARRDRLAFFIPRVVDLQCLLSLQFEAAKYAYMLSSPIFSKELKDGLKEDFKVPLNLITDGIREGLRNREAVLGIVGPTETMPESLYAHAKNNGRGTRYSDYSLVVLRSWNIGAVSSQVSEQEGSVGATISFDLDTTRKGEFVTLPIDDIEMAIATRTGFNLD